MALEEQEVELPIKGDIDLFIMYVNDEEKKYALYLQQELRMAGFSTDTEYTGRSLKAQFKQADRLKAKFLLILNSDDLNNGEVQVKNCTTKEEEKIQIEYLIYYLDEKLVDDESCDFDLEKLGQNLATDDCCCDDCCTHHHEGED